MVRLEFELAYYNVAVHHIVYNTTQVLPKRNKTQIISIW